MHDLCDLLCDQYIDSQNLGKKIKRYNPLMFFITLTIALISLSFFIFDAGEITYFISWFLFVFLLVFITIKINDNILFKRLNIPNNNKIFNSRAHRLYQEKKVRLFEKKLIKLKLLTGKTKKDIKILKIYSKMLQKEAKRKYTDPYVFISSAVFIFLISPIWFGFVDIMVSTVPDERKMEVLFQKCLPFFLALLAIAIIFFTFKDALFDIINSKSQKYLKPQKYIDILISEYKLEKAFGKK